jgi:hypothetical protein
VRFARDQTGDRTFFLQYFFHKRVPFAAGWAFSNPFRTLGATILTKESGFGFGHFTIK